MDPIIARPLLIVALVAALSLAAPTLHARQAVVTTKGGQTYTGELIQDDPNQVVLEISGVRAAIPRHDIASFQLKKSPVEEYTERRAALADDDYPGRYALAMDLYKDKSLDLCLRELESMEADFADRNPAEVRRQIAMIRSQMELQQQNAPAAPGASNDAAPSAERGLPMAGDVPLLTDSQISTIRLWELPADLAATRPPVTVPPDVIDDLFARYATDERVPKGRDEQRRFRAAEGWEQLQLIFQVQARDLYPRVIVRTDPAALIEFRRTLNPIYVARYFRETFEGKVEGLDLKLAAQDPAAIPEVYTNFYLLSTARYNGRPLIDRDQPADSLLIQWGLPRDAAKYPAPDVPNWKPFFRNLDDPRLATYLAWIDTLYKRPQYDIQYPPRPEAQPVNPPQGSGQ